MTDPGCDDDPFASMSRRYETHREEANKAVEGARVVSEKATIENIKARRISQKELVKKNAMFWAKFLDVLE